MGNQFIPSPPWSSSSAPSNVLQLKCLRTSSTTRGVTIMCTSLRTRPSRTNQSGRTILLITRSLHCRACKLEDNQIIRLINNCLMEELKRSNQILFVEGRFSVFVAGCQWQSFGIPVKCKEADRKAEGVQNLVFNCRDENVKLGKFGADATWTQVCMSSNRPGIGSERRDTEICYTCNNPLYKNLKSR